MFPKELGLMSLSHSLSEKHTHTWEAVQIDKNAQEMIAPFYTLLSHLWE